jgi:hypothetical protein
MSCVPMPPGEAPGEPGGEEGAPALSHLPPSSLAHLPPLPYARPSAAYMHRIEAMMALARAGAAEEAAATHPLQQATQPTPSRTAGDTSRTGAVPAGSTAGASKATSTHDQQGYLQAARSQIVDQQSGSSQQGQFNSTGNAASPAAADRHGSPPQSSGSGPVGSASGAEAKACPYIGLTLSSNFFDAQDMHVVSGACVTTPRTLPQEQCCHEQLAPYCGHCLLLVLFCCRDDTMACTISRALLDSQHTLPSPPGPGPLVVHVCGKAHCEHRLGIPEHLQHYAPHACTGPGGCLPACKVTRDLMNKYPCMGALASPVNTHLTQHLAQALVPASCSAQ